MILNPIRFGLAFSKAALKSGPIETRLTLKCFSRRFEKICQHTILRCWLSSYRRALKSLSLSQRCQLWPCRSKKERGSTVRTTGCARPRNPQCHAAILADNLLWLSVRISFRLVSLTRVSQPLPCLKSFLQDRKSLKKVESIDSMRRKLGTPRYSNSVGERAGAAVARSTEERTRQEQEEVGDGNN